MFTKRFPAFNSNDFKTYWTAGLISNIGTEMQFVAVSWQVYSLSHSPFALGIIGLLRFFPVVFFSLLGGIAADSYNRKKLQFITLFGFMTCSFLLAFTDFTQTINLTIIYILTFLSASFFAFDLPARHSFMPGLVEKENLTSAYSLNSVMFQTASIIGPAIAGILIAKSHLWVIYLIDAISYLIVIGGLRIIKSDGNIVGKSSELSFASLKEGFKFVRGKTMIWSTMTLDFFSTFFSSARALLPIFATSILSVGPTGLGLLYSAEAIGSVIAGVVVANHHNMKRQGKILLASVGFYAIGTIIFGLSNIFIISFAALMLIGAADSVSAIIRNTLRQLETPDYIRGRMTSINMIFFMGGPMLGDFEAGTLAGYIGASKSVVFGGIATLFVIAVMAKKIPQLLKYDRHVPEVI